MIQPALGTIVPTSSGRDDAFVTVSVDRVGGGSPSDFVFNISATGPGTSYPIASFVHNGPAFGFALQRGQYSAKVTERIYALGVVNRTHTLETTFRVGETVATTPPSGGGSNQLPPNELPISNDPTAPVPGVGVQSIFSGGGNTGLVAIGIGAAILIYLLSK
jgi:hypothetical protein